MLKVLPFTRLPALRGMGRKSDGGGIRSRKFFEASVERYMCRVEGIEKVVTTKSQHVKSGEVRRLAWHG